MHMYIIYIACWLENNEHLSNYAYTCTCMDGSIYIGEYRVKLICIARQHARMVVAFNINTQSCVSARRGIQLKQARASQCIYIRRIACSSNTYAAYTEECMTEYAEGSCGSV